MKWHGRFLFFLLSFWFIAAARGQTISLSVKNEPLEKVFVLIEQQSDYHFIYTTGQLAKAKPVTLSVTNEPLTGVLDKCFAGQPLEYRIYEKNITVREKKETSAARSLQGRVLDQAGNPMKGVTVVIRHTPLVAVSDGNGVFSFSNAPPDAMLLLTSVEIEDTEYFAYGQANVEIRVNLKVGLLDETIVIAYGKSSRRFNTGTVSSIKEKEIATQPSPNALSILAGRVPGLQVSQVSGVPGSFIKLQLRGQNSIANGKDPLIIIDGIPFPSQPLNGALGGGAGVTASPLNALSPSDIASIEVLKDADATSIYGSRGANGVILITTKRAMQGGIRTTLRLLHGAGNITRRMDLMKTPDYLIMRREAYTNDGLIPGASDAPDLLSWDTTRYTDWQKVLIGRTMYNSDASISVNGGNSQTQFLLGAAWHRQTAVFPGDFGEDRKTTTLSVSHMPENRRLKITASTFYSRYHNKLPQSDFFSDITLSPNAPALYQADGELNWEGSSWVNPLTKQFATFESTTDNFNSNIDVSYHVLSSLWLRFTGGFSSLSSRDLIQTPKLSFNPAWGNASSAGFGSKTLYTIIGEPQAEYRQSLGHGNLSLLGGITLQQSRQRGLYQTGTGYASDDLLESVRAASQLTTVNESDIKYRYSGIFARISYEHAKKYLLTLTARRDGSSRYGDQERFANFGSAGMAWIFSSEPLLHKLRFLSFGKLKGSAGITGNDQIGDYRYLKLYNSGTYAYLGVVPYYPAQHYNPRFSWEKLRKLEAGLDLGFFDDRFLLMVNYYHNTTSNQLVNYPLPLATGFSGILRNIPAVIRNTGWEFEFNGKLLARTKLTWDMAFNITLPRNKLVSFDNLENSSYAYQYVIGQPLSIERKLSHTGLDRQTGIYSFRDYNNDGVIDYSNDLQQIIFTGQQYYGGWQNTITLGRFSGNVLFQFVRQKNGSNYLYLFSQPGRPYNQPGFLSDRWQKPGDNAGHQRYAYANSSAGASYFNYSQSDAAFSDASYIRLRNLSVSYSLFKKGKIPQGSFFVEGLNLVTITNYKGLDPENLSQSVPPVRMIVAGFQITL